jgi:hypothetical protein
MANVRQSIGAMEKTPELVIKGDYFIAPATTAKALKNSGTWGTAIPSSPSLARHTKHEQSKHTAKTSAPKSAK